MTPSIRTAKVDFWKARELVGEDEAAKIWADAGGDQDEVLQFDYGFKDDE